MHRDRIERRRAYQLVLAVKAGVGQVLGQPLDSSWYLALCDSPEEAQALYTLHAAQATMGGRMNGYGGNN